MKEKIKEKSPNNFNKESQPLEKRKKMLLLLCGALVGSINGLFGGGGGMIVVPILLYVFAYKTKFAHATAILIILPISLFSGLIYIANKNFDLSFSLYVVLGVVLGGILGALLLKKLPPKWVSLIFSFLMLFAGAKMLFF